MRNIGLTIMALIALTATSLTTACSVSPSPSSSPPITSEDRREPMRPAMVTGVVISAAAYTYNGTTTVVVEVQSSDGALKTYECSPWREPVCILLRPGDHARFTPSGTGMVNVTRTQAATPSPTAKR